MLETALPLSQAPRAYLEATGRRISYSTVWRLTASGDLRTERRAHQVYLLGTIADIVKSIDGAPGRRRSAVAA